MDREEVVSDLEKLAKEAEAIIEGKLVHSRVAQWMRDMIGWFQKQVNPPDPVEADLEPVKPDKAAKDEPPPPKL